MKELHVSNFFSIEDFPYPDLWRDMLIPWGPLLTLKNFLDNFSHFSIRSPIPEGVILRNPESISMGENCVIFPGSYIEGPCIIGNHCQVRPGAWIRPYVICGNQCVIGHSTEIKHSLLFSQVRIPHFSYIGDSIIGPGANIGAGVVLSNLRLDQKFIVLKIAGREIPTPLKKMGAIIGQEVQIGCNAVLNPGTLIGKKSLCYPGESINGWYPPASRIRSVSYETEAK